MFRNSGQEILYIALSATTTGSPEHEDVVPTEISKFNKFGLPSRHGLKGAILNMKITVFVSASSRFDIFFLFFFITDLLVGSVSQTYT